MLETSDKFVPIPFSIIAAGKKQRHKSLIDKLVRNEHWHLFDVVKDLPKDPYAGGVGWDENGTYANTQRLVIEQENFPEVIEDLTTFLLTVILKNGGGGLVVECNHGQHRSDVVSRWLESAANAMVVTVATIMMLTQLPLSKVVMPHCLQ